jgi:hypothetical protein
MWLKVTTPVTLITLASPPIRNLEALILTDVLDDDDDEAQSLDLTNRVNACFKAHSESHACYSNTPATNAGSNTERPSSVCS